MTRANIELPAFSTLDRLAGRLRQQVHDQIFAQITAALSDEQAAAIDALLMVPEGQQVTGFTQLKQTPGTPTLMHIREWSDRLDWLTALFDPKPFLKDIAHTKIRQFAAEASANEISDMRNSANLARRRTLLVCLLHEAQTRTRDHLIEMFLRRMKKTEYVAKEKLGQIQQGHRALEESLIGAFAEVLRHARDDEASDEHFGRDVRHSLSNLGGVETLQRQYEAVSAYHHNNYLPLMWDIHAKNRAALFRLLSLMQVGAASQDNSLIQAIEFVVQHRYARREFLPLKIDLNFASERWRNFVVTREDKVYVLDQQHAIA